MFTQAQCSHVSLFSHSLVLLCFTAFDRKCYDSILKNIFKGCPSHAVSKFKKCLNAQLTKNNLFPH